METLKSNSSDTDYDKIMNLKIGIIMIVKMIQEKIQL